MHGKEIRAKAKIKGSSSAHIHALEDKPKSSVQD